MVVTDGGVTGVGRVRPGRLEAEVVIPLRWGDDGDDYRVERMGRYLAGLRQAVVAITVVDGSAPERRRVHEAAWGSYARIIEPDEATVVMEPGGPRARPRTLNGKVVGAMTGIRRARYDAVVLADDDVRHTPDTLGRLVEALARADLVRPVCLSWPSPPDEGPGRSSVSQRWACWSPRGAGADSAPGGCPPLCRSGRRCGCWNEACAPGRPSGAGSGAASGTTARACASPPTRLPSSAGPERGRHGRLLRGQPAPRTPCCLFQIRRSRRA